MIRGAVYRIDLGQARGHEQRGKRLGLVISPSDLALSVVTVIPTSTAAQPSIHRPELDIAGRATFLLIDQIRSIDTDYLVGEPVDYLSREEMARVEHALAYYLGLVAVPRPG
ncbi:Putative toxinA [Acidipropionibacterium virtanenii]|uniref:ToxinA n=1 Tax=Acidipropionibacterium virtanenii TaxID=2057246 RepID=A0A344UVW2_9ACTN|nr:Putative toxinA [Acidipropionibacterium virtanenii]